MPTDATGAGDQGGGQPKAGLLDDPRWLAAGAGGLVAACVALWAFRGLPLGVVALWLSPLPLFLAGLGFGTAAAGGATLGAIVAIWLAGSPAGVWLFALGFGLPAWLLTLAHHAARGVGPGLGHPLVLLGILPAAGIVVAALWFADSPGGLDGVLQAMARSGLRRLDLPGSAALASSIVRVNAAAIGFWLALAWLANAWLAAKLLARAGLVPAPAWSTARLPSWYVWAPAIAFGAWLAADDGADAAQRSLLLVLMVPLMLHGLAAMHTRTRGLGERPLLLGVVYVSLLMLFVPASLAVAGYGVFDLLRRGGTAPPAGPRNS